MTTRIEREVAARRTEVARGRSDQEHTLDVVLDRMPIAVGGEDHGECGCLRCQEEAAALEATNATPGMHPPEPSAAEVLAAAGSERFHAMLQASVLHTAAKGVVNRATIIGSEVLVPLAEFNALAQATALVADTCPDCGSEMSEWGAEIVRAWDSQSRGYDKPTGAEFRECLALNGRKCEHRQERGETTRRLPPLRVPPTTLDAAGLLNAGGRGLDVTA
jgi:hypothetical protein